MEGGLICNNIINPHLRGYIQYFTAPVLLSMAPIFFLFIVGALTYRNVSMLQRVNVRQRAQHHLVSMILLETVSIVIGSVPYGLQSIYLAITTYTVKDSDRKTIEDAIFQIVNTTYYFPHTFSFFVYFISSATFRDQVRTILHIPLQATGTGLRDLRTRKGPIQIVA
ncbi:hypothetical protein I4U23_005450 [Adineta vaga]|nr:hypothetical protein I4U23_005450 [Adineta vaga]